MIVDSVFIVAGLALLIVGGDFLVRGAVSLSLRMGLSALVVSLTVVAFGTSAPELLIAIQAALAGAPGIAFGNVVGSNIANIWLVLGVPALISSIYANGADIQRSFLIMMTVTALFIILSFMGPFGIGHGLILLTVLTLVLIDTVRISRTAPDSAVAEEAAEYADPDGTPARIAMFLGLGLVGLPLGANILIRGATGIAEHFGLPDAVIGLTIVAVGTSLPELATTVMAAFRRQADVALGNVIGSNMFNILAIMGVASLFGPLPLPYGFLTYDLWVMVAASAALIPFVFFGIRLGKRWGIVFVLTYVLYIVSIAITHTGGS